MADIKDAVKKAVQLSERLREVGNGYFISTPLSSVSSMFGDQLLYSLFDWGLMSAISESTMLITGDTDRGKTDFARVLMTALFGKEDVGWHKTNVDLDFGSLTYSGNDFSAITEGKSSDELFFAKQFVKFPGLLWDEPNRTNAKLANKLIHILEKDFTLENGTRVLSGTEYETTSGRKARYQINVLMMNEGEAFKGTSDVDRALRRRQTIEIPIDVFPTTMTDKREMCRNRTGQMALDGDKGKLNDIIAIVNAISELSMSYDAEQYRLYLQAMNCCKNSLTGTKKGINFGEHLCSLESKGPTGTQMLQAVRGVVPSRGCHYLASYPDKMCPNVMGISDGLSIQFNAIARAHALLRAVKVVEIIGKYLNLEDGADYKRKAANALVNGSFYKKVGDYLGVENADSSALGEFVHKYIEELVVGPEDMMAVFPFIAYSKLELNSDWVERNHQGSRFLAINGIGKIAYDRVVKFQRECPETFKSLVTGVALSQRDEEIIAGRCRDDYWLEKSIQAYAQRPNGNGTEKCLELLSK